MCPSLDVPLPGQTVTSQGKSQEQEQMEVGRALLHPQAAGRGEEG